MINLLADAVNAAGSAPAAILLLRLRYWAGKTKYVRANRKWVVMTREEWCVETGASEKQHRTAMEALVSRGLIEVEHHLHYKLRKSWIFLTEKGWGSCPEGPGVLPSAARGSALSGQTTCPQGPAKKSVDKSVDNRVDNLPQLSQRKQKSGPTEQNTEGTQIMKTGIGKTVSEILSEAKTKPPSPPSGSGHLYAIWQAGVHESTKAYVPPLTMKQQGKLGHFRKRCPAGEASGILEKVLRDWSEFTYHVKHEAGLKMTPDSPSIDFLLYHVVHALSFAEGYSPNPQEAKIVAMDLPAKMQMIAPVTHEPDAPMTLDQLYASLAGKPDAI